MPKASPNGRVRLEIAFEGGQIVGGNVSGESADGLRIALAGDDLVYDLETEDGIYIIALRKVVYVRRTSRETHIGFGAAT
ncbi:MAG TPA: hypothetical protein VE693_06260 [Gaiellaceae bacterium]|nr:hypothetical protein [Gaiellaceae bacterium]